MKNSNNIARQPRLQQTAVGSWFSFLSCFFVGHKVVYKKCQRCGKTFGVPKMSNPPCPPKN